MNCLCVLTECRSHPRVFTSNTFEELSSSSLPLHSCGPPSWRGGHRSMPKSVHWAGMGAVLMLTPLILTALSQRRARSPTWEPLQPTGVLPVADEPFTPPPQQVAALPIEDNGPSTTTVASTASVSTVVPPSRRHHQRWLTAPLWQPTPEEAPWYFPGMAGRSSRASAQFSMRKNSGFMPRDSPLPPARTTTHPVLTGTSYHWPLSMSARGGGGDGPCGGGCSGKGVCVPHLGRCDCGPYTWGADCSIPVVTQTICVYNDSQPWFCDKPACMHKPDEMIAPYVGGPPRRCVGAPLDRCPQSCHGRGACMGGRCACYEGYQGVDCATPSPAVCLGNCSGRGQCQKGWCKCTPPYWGTDCARGGGRGGGRGVGRARERAAAVGAALGAAGSGPRCTKSPCVYVYDLPPRHNVLALKAEYDWRVQVRGPRLDGTPGHACPCLAMPAHACPCLAMLAHA